MNNAARPHTSQTTKKMPRVRYDAVIQVEDSTMITGIQYDHKKSVMDVQFAKGDVYRYLNVTPLEFTLLVTSRSTGKTFNSVIKNVKEYKKSRRKMIAEGVRR